MADKALLTGINSYKHISHLRGCINDVRTVQGLLVDVFGFKQQQIQTLVDDEVTKDKIMKGWKWLFKDSKPGDRLIFHFSGHGSFTADTNADEDDGVDELLCLHDMDFDDDQTYLLDDDLNRLTTDLPTGVFLTILLDCCHSGTATRLLMSPADARGMAAEGRPPMVDLNSSLARLRSASISSSMRNLQMQSLADSGDVVHDILAPRNIAEARNTVLARFVEPPPRILAALHKGGVQRSLRTAMAERTRGPDMNHVLLAGSHATQTSADAFIDDDFHGAFSHSLNKAIRSLGAQGRYRDVLAKVRAFLSDGNFTQNPQLEPEQTDMPIFGGVQKVAPSPESTMAQPADDLRNELVQLVREVRDLVRGAGAASLPRQVTAHGLVYVHGICRHDPGYSEPWWNALRPHLPNQLADELDRNRHEVLWSDLVTRERVARALDRAETEQEDFLADELRDALEDRAQREALNALPTQQRDAAPAPAPLAMDRALFGIPGLDCVDDFVKYLLRDSVRREVQKRFVDKVEPLLVSGRHVSVISHSWGTVVAYEALRTLDGRQFSGQVTNLFTVGSALSITHVQRRMQIRDGARPLHVKRWINIDATGDIVGGRLAGMFRVDAEFLNLDPVGCRIVFGRTSPSCAHGSYFDPDNIAVNRDIFASEMGK